MTFRVGFASTIITPPLGTPIYRGLPAGIVWDDLWARALAFECRGRRALLLSCDLLEVEDRFTRLVAGDLHASVGLDSQGLLLACTHSHSSPAMMVQPDEPTAPGTRGRSESWEAFLRERLTAVGREAFARLEPATARAGQGRSRAGVNRRALSRRGVLHVRQDPDGLIDSRVSAVEFLRSNGSRIAALAHYACHPVLLMSFAAKEAFVVSRDYPGATVDLLEQELGCPAVFLNGTCGNINPALHGLKQDSEQDRSECVYRTGEMIAEAALRGLRKAAPLSLDNPFVIHAEPLELALCDWPEFVNGASPAPDDKARRIRNVFRKMERRIIDRSNSRARIRTALTAIRMGELAFIGFPGEAFVEWGLTARRLSPTRFTLPLGNANDYAGYFPTERSLGEGGMGTRLQMFCLHELALQELGSGLRRALRALRT